MTTTRPDEHDEQTASGDSEEVRSQTTEEIEEGPPPTPFDHPFFLPVVLVALTLWFGYDGFINQDPDMLEHLTFNRGGFALFLLLSLWYGYKAVQETREIKEEAARREGPRDPSA